MIEDNFLKLKHLKPSLEYMLAGIFIFIPTILISITKNQTIISISQSILAAGFIILVQIIIQNYWLKIILEKNIQKYIKIIIKNISKNKEFKIPKKLIKFYSNPILNKERERIKIIQKILVQMQNKQYSKDILIQDIKNLEPFILNYILKNQNLDWILYISNIKEEFIQEELRNASLS